VQTRKGVALFAVAAIAGACLSGCASAAAPADTPAWFKAKLTSLEHGYPRLEDVPQASTANVNQNHWNQVQSDVVAAGQAMRSNPRDQPAANDDPNAFMNDARQQLDHTRAAHSDDAPAH